MPYLNNLLQWVQTHPEEIRAIAADVARGISEAMQAVLNVGQALLPTLDHIASAVETMSDAFAAASSVVSKLGEALDSVASVASSAFDFGGNSGGPALFDDFASAAVAAADGRGRGSTGGDRGSSGVDFGPARVVIGAVNMDLDPDLGVASSQIADKIRPAINEAVRARYRQADNAAMAAMLKL
jgi:hypothetical protein